MERKGPKTDDAYYMRKAVCKAKKGMESGQSPFGACIVLDGKVVVTEHNHVWKNGDPTAHAEIMAIRKAAKRLGRIDLSGATIYSTCEPCPMCFSACHWARITRIVYGARIEDAKKAGFHEFPVHDTTLKEIGRSRIKITGDFMRKENLELFSNWKSKKGNSY